MNLRISISGVKEIDDCLRGLPLQVQDSVLTKVHTDSAFPLVSAAHLLAPVGKTGNLAESIGVVKAGIKRGGNIGQVNIGPRRGGGFKGHHGHLIEFGKTNRNGTKTSPNPFMERGWKQSKDEVEHNIAAAIGKRLFSFMKRTLRHG